MFEQTQKVIFDFFPSILVQTRALNHSQDFVEFSRNIQPCFHPNLRKDIPQLRRNRLQIIPDQR